MSSAYAGRWAVNPETGLTECVELLSGDVGSEVIQVETITDRDENVIGLSMSYKGSPSGDYVLFHIYCDHDRTELQWDKTYTTHSSGVDTYYQMTMNSVTGCIVIQTDSYWFFLKKLKYLFALVGMVGGILTCMAGRLLLLFVQFAGVVCAMITVTNALLFAIADGAELSTYVYWLAFIVAGVCGLLLAWLSTKYKAGGALILAGWTGFELGVALSNLLYFQVKNVVLFWLIIGVTALIIVLVAATNINHHMLWITAIFGAYLFIISLSLFVGRWPIDLNLPKLEQVGAVNATEPNYYLYMGIWLCMSCLGVAFQCYILWYYKKTGKKVNPKI